MTFDEFTDKLKDAGWRATCDAQYTGIERLYNEIMLLDRAAREECAELCEKLSCEPAGYVAYIIRKTIKK